MTRTDRQRVRSMSERPIVLADGTVAELPPTDEWRSSLNRISHAARGNGVTSAGEASLQRQAIEVGLARGVHSLGDPEERVARAMPDLRAAGQVEDIRGRAARLPAVVIVVLAAMMLVAAWMLPWHPVPATCCVALWLGAMLLGLRHER